MSGLCWRLFHSVRDPDRHGGERDSGVGERDCCDLVAATAHALGALDNALTDEPAYGERDVADGPSCGDGDCGVYDEADDSSARAKEEALEECSMAMFGLPGSGLSSTIGAGHRVVDAIVVCRDKVIAEAATIGAGDVGVLGSGELRHACWGGSGSYDRQIVWSEVFGEIGHVGARLA